MPEGKAAGLACPRLDAALRCSLFGRAERPAVCSSLSPEEEMCGSSSAEALAFLARLESSTDPARGKNG